MHLRPKYACLSHWHSGNFKLECCYVAFFMRMHVEPFAKCRIHFVQAKPSILCQQLSDMKTVVFWCVTPCSLIDNRTWFRENVSLKWARDRTGRSTHTSIVFAVSIEFRNTCYDFLWILSTYNGIFTTIFTTPDGKKNIHFYLIKQNIMRKKNRRYSFVFS
jgi:hypothetical protein